MRIFAIVLLLWSLYSSVSCKECTNDGLSSHTLRSQMLKNESLKGEMLIGGDDHHHHHHLTPTDESAWSNLHPDKEKKKQGKEEVPWLMMYRKMKNPLFKDGNFLKEISLHYVRLDPESVHGKAQQTNLEYLLMLDVDSLVWSFRNTAGLPTLGHPYGGWEDPTMELRGHFVGHYLSATAQTWASTHNDALKRRMTAVVSALSACQFFIGSGYLSAFPSTLFDRFEQLTRVWAPYYTIHKIMAGLLDQYILASNGQALKVVNWMADYFFNRVQNVIINYSIERHWQSLNEETGGMNDLLYRLYTVTGNQKHLLLAHLFDKPCFLGLLAVKADDISGFHANTHIPIVVGSQMRYEITGEPLYKEIGMFFMDIMNSSHVYATGGTTLNELWTEPNRLASSLTSENEETCTTYNMLKVSRNLFRWTKGMAYADYYERALTNGIMSIQRGRDPGVMIYMLPLAPGSSKAATFHGWGNQFDSFWCCYGTGIESFSKLGDSIYFEEGGDIPGLYIIQYISSSINWISGQIILTQKVERMASFDPVLRVTLTVSKKSRTGVESTLHLRLPSWTYFYGSKALLNDENLSLPSPGNFLSITRKWSSGDKINLELPFGLRTEAIKDDRPEYSSVQAVLYGPYLLAGLSNGDWEIKTSSSLSDWITPIPETYNSQLISLSQQSGDTTFVFTNSNDTITLEKYPYPGTDAAVQATFRLIRTDSTNSPSPKSAIGKYVRLEPMNFPGKLVAQRGAGEELVVADYGQKGGTIFRMIEGLDGDGETISLESDSELGCFVLRTGSDITLSCKSDSGMNSVHAFEQAASFKMESGISEYHPVSFVAEGDNRNYLFSPLFSLRDESYAVYFNVHS